MSTSPAGVEPPRSADAACLDRSDARRRAGDRLSAWLADAEPVIGQADRRHIAALAAELSGKEDPQMAPMETRRLVFARLAYN